MKIYVSKSKNLIKLSSYTCFYLHFQKKIGNKTKNALYPRGNAVSPDIPITLYPLLSSCRRATEPHAHPQKSSRVFASRPKDRLEFSLFPSHTHAYTHTHHIHNTAYNPEAARKDIGGRDRRAITWRGGEARERGREREREREGGRRGNGG